MTVQQRARFQARLLAERKMLTATLDRIAARSGAADLEGRSGEPGTEYVAGTSGAGPDDDVAIAARAMTELADIDAALSQLYEHPERYGICTVCGDPISLARLEILPMARYCEKHTPPLGENTGKSMVA